MTQGNSTGKDLSVVVCFVNNSGAYVQDDFALSFSFAINWLKL
jgi:hypothetical protein